MLPVELPVEGGREAKEGRHAKIDLTLASQLAFCTEEVSALAF